MSAFFRHIEKNIKIILLWLRDKIKNSPLYGRTLLVLLFMALILKGVIIYLSYQNNNLRENIISYLASDIPIIIFTHLLVMFNYWIKKRKYRLINDIIIFVVLLLYIVDIFTLSVFHSRVALADIFMLGSDGAYSFSGMIKLWIFVFLIIWFVIFILVQTKMKYGDKSFKNMVLIFSSCFFIYSWFYIILVLSGVNIDYVDNVVLLNIQKFKEFRKELNLEDSDVNVSKDYEVKQVKGEGRDLNVILVFAESLSAIDSANVGGNNNLPNFDKIQKDGITFTNFVTNGTTSDTAHIATLLGVLPLRNMRIDNTPYSGYKLKMETLPKFLNSQGYMTTFVSTVSLDFLKQRNFLSGAGFQKIIGEEEFEGKEQYTFDAAPDRDLYDRVLQEVQVQTGKYFIGLQTISFHKPYNTPYGKTADLALKYSDEELYRFYQGLQKIGFFDNGILVILGDHRKMSAIEEGERDVFGSNRYTRSVATVVGSGIQTGTSNSKLVQHTDFYNSLKVLLGSGYVAVDSMYNDTFSPKTNRNRGITNSSFYIENGYTISSYSGDTFIFKNLSNLPTDNPIYNYFSSYVSFEFGNQEYDDKNQKRDNDGIKIIGHRGSIGSAPENTFESFLVAKELGADGIEFDVSYTKDHKNVVMHGETLYASRCYKNKVGDFDLEWIQENCPIVNGETYKELQKMLELIDGLFDYYFLEIKVYDENLGAQQTLDAIQTVKDLNMQDRVIFISYSDSAREILSSDPDIIFGRDIRGSEGLKDLEFIGDNNSQYFLAPYDILTTEIVQKAESLGKKVATYTVNDTGGFQAVKDLGIDIIMTDKIKMIQDYDSIPNKISNEVEIDLSEGKDE